MLHENTNIADFSECFIGHASTAPSLLVLSKVLPNDKHYLIIPCLHQSQQNNNQTRHNHLICCSVMLAVIVFVKQLKMSLSFQMARGSHSPQSLTISFFVTVCFAFNKIRRIWFQFVHLITIWREHLVQLIHSPKTDWLFNVKTKSSACRVTWVT